MGACDIKMKHGIHLVKAVNYCSYYLQWFNFCYQVSLHCRGDSSLLANSSAGPFLSLANQSMHWKANQATKPRTNCFSVENGRYRTNAPSNRIIRKDEEAVAGHKERVSSAVFVRIGWCVDNYTLLSGPRWKGEAYDPEQQSGPQINST